MKKDGGLLKDWQLHTFAIGEVAQEIKDREKLNGHNITTDVIYVMTGTVVEDPTGRWDIGDSVRSSIIVNIDRENNVVETFNTMYNVINEGNGAIPDLGADIAFMFF